MGSIASQITSLTSAYSSVYSGADQRQHQSSASLTFVRAIHRRPVNSPHKWPVTRKMFPFDDVIMGHQLICNNRTGRCCNQYSGWLRYNIRHPSMSAAVKTVLWELFRGAKHTAVSITCICMNMCKSLDTQQCVWLIFIQVQSFHGSQCKQAVISQWIWRFSLYVVRCLSHIPIPITFHRQFRPFWTDALYRVYRLLNWNPAPIPLNPPRSGPMTTSSEHLPWYIPF